MWIFLGSSWTGGTERLERCRCRYRWMSVCCIYRNIAGTRGRVRRGAAVKLHTDKIEEYVEQLVAKKFPPGVAEQDPGVAEQPWGSLDMVLVDPFGNRLIFTNASAPVPRGSSKYSQ
jgi:hypothetical protein